MFIVRTLVVYRELLLLLTLSGRGPAQSAEREWPREGSEAEGRSQWAANGEFLE